MHSGGERERGVRLEEDIGAGKRHAIDVGGKQHAQQIPKRGRLPAAFGDQPMRVGQREHARLVFGREVRDAARIPRGLREQREQLREQVSRAVP